MSAGGPRPLVAIVNPTAGVGRQAGARALVEQLTACAAAHDVTLDVRVTERTGHARHLTQAAVAGGAMTVIACGGDGTVNEVASALAFRDVTLAVVPAGSGNGLARDLGVPLELRAALDTALLGVDRRIDAGELDGRLFCNVAGIGLDARVARRFAQIGQTKRGLWRYVQAAAREVLCYTPDDITLCIGHERRPVRPLIVAFANTRQYGNGALIAPRARPDDGLLDLVVVDSRSLWRLVWGVPALFSGRIDDQPGVSSAPVTAVHVSGERPLLCHVDGEPHEGGLEVSIRVRPGALLVRVPG